MEEKIGIRKLSGSSQKKSPPKMDRKEWLGKREGCELQFLLY